MPTPKEQVPAGAARFGCVGFIRHHCLHMRKMETRWRRQRNLKPLAQPANPPRRRITHLPIEQIMKTPRTDEFVAKIKHMKPQAKHANMVMFARKLEREIAKVNSFRERTATRLRSANDKVALLRTWLPSQEPLNP